MAVGQPRALVERAACQRAEPVEMRLDMAEQPVVEMDAQQIGQGRIGAIEIQARGVRRQQAGLASRSGTRLSGRVLHFLFLVRSALSCPVVGRRMIWSLLQETAPMPDNYRIFGAEMSPYSVKVRSYFRYKGIPHQWILRNARSPGRI